MIQLGRLPVIFFMTTPLSSKMRTMDQTLEIKSFDPDLNQETAVPLDECDSGGGIGRCCSNHSRSSVSSSYSYFDSSPLSRSRDAATNIPSLTLDSSSICGVTKRT